MTRAMTHIAYFGTIALLFAIVPMGYLGNLQSMTKTLFIVGFLGMWRYGWALVNFTRAFIYRFRVYPRRKAAYQRRFEQLGAPSHMYVMITSYMVDPDVTLMVYRRLFAACANARDGATIVASVVDGADERLIRQIYDSSREDLRDTRLVIDRIKANGKRDAMMKALRILATFQPTQHDIMVFIDGDTAPPPDLWAQAAPVFSDPGVGALTTDEAALIDKPGLFRDWFDLRFHQRNVMMCSMGLSKRVLTLTGRLSVFRAALATDPGFIRGVGQDYLDHWRLGRIDFLTGDDKSTWFWLLTHGYQTVYLPDVQSESVETQPRPTFYDSARTLMIRWFGNMMRTNGRALRLPPGRIGYFTWWSILDQKVSMWTTLVGPLSVLFTAVLHSAWVLPLYAGWVLLTRYSFCMVIAIFNRCWFPITHPPVLYFSQVFGAIIKTYVFFRLDRQKWTRQASSSGGAVKSLADRIKQMESVAHHAVALSFLALAILFLNTVE